jgi:hypothetical protein
MTAVVSVVSLRLLIEIRDHLDGDESDVAVILMKSADLPEAYGRALLRWLQELDQ